MKKNIKQKLKFTTTKLYSFKNPGLSKPQPCGDETTTPITTTVTTVLTCGQF